jgi:hypothetical protein
MLHPFWDGFFGELRKEALVGEAVEMAQAHPVAAAGIATAAGLGTIALGRRLGIRGFHKAAPPAHKAAPPAAGAAPGGGFKAKHLALVGLGSAAIGAYAMKRHKDKDK